MTQGIIWGFNNHEHMFFFRNKFTGKSYHFNHGWIQLFPHYLNLKWYKPAKKVKTAEKYFSKVCLLKGKYSKTVLSILWGVLILFTVSGCEFLLEEREDMGPQDTKKEAFKESISLADTLFVQKKFEEAVDAYLKVLVVAKGLKDQHQEASINYQLGQSYFFLQDFPTALIYFNNCLEILGKDNFTKMKAKALSRIGTIYQIHGDFPKAFETLLEALTIREKNRENDHGIARINYLLGNLLYYQERYSEATVYYRRAQRLADNNRLKCNAIIGTGCCFEGNQDLDRALKIFNYALEIAENDDYSRGIAYAKQNLGKVLGKTKAFVQAERNLKDAITIFEEMKEYYGIIQTKIYLGDLYNQQEKYNTAVVEFNESLRIIDSVGQTYWKPRGDALFGLANSYKGLGNFSIAFDLLEEGFKKKDSLLNEQTLNQMAKVQSIYELNKKQAVIDRQSFEADILKQKNKAKTATNYLFSFIAVFFLIFSVTILFFYHRQKRTTAQISFQKSYIEKQNKQLEHYNAELSNYAYIASHDLREPLRTISAFTGLIKRQADDTFTETTKEYFGYILGAVNRMQQLLEDLLSYSRIDSEAAEKKWISSADVLKNVKNDLIQRINENEAQILVNYDDMPDLYIPETHLHQLFQNVINNAIKFKKDDQSPIVDIKCKKERESYVFSFTDNGVGIPAEKKEKIFEMFTRLDKRHRYDGTGIGLATCKKIVLAYEGEIWVESEEGVGSTFFIRLPMARIKERKISK